MDDSDESDKENRFDGHDVDTTTIITKSSQTKVKRTTSIQRYVLQTTVIETDGQREIATPVATSSSWTDEETKRIAKHQASELQFETGLNVIPSEQLFSYDDLFPRQPLIDNEQSSRLDTATRGKLQLSGWDLSGRSQSVGADQRVEHIGSDRAFEADSRGQTSSSTLELDERAHSKALLQAELERRSDFELEQQETAHKSGHIVVGSLEYQSQDTNKLSQQNNNSQAHKVSSNVSSRFCQSSSSSGVVSGAAQAATSGSRKVGSKWILHPAISTSQRDIDDSLVVNSGSGMLGVQQEFSGESKDSQAGPKLKWILHKAVASNDNDEQLELRGRKVLIQEVDSQAEQTSSMRNLVERNLTRQIGYRANDLAAEGEPMMFEHYVWEQPGVGLELPTDRVIREFERSRYILHPAIDRDAKMQEIREEDEYENEYEIADLQFEEQDANLELKYRSDTDNSNSLFVESDLVEQNKLLPSNVGDRSIETAHELNVNQSSSEFVQVDSNDISKQLDKSIIERGECSSVTDMGEISVIHDDDPAIYDYKEPKNQVIEATEIFDENSGAQNMYQTKQVEKLQPDRKETKSSWRILKVFGRKTDSGSKPKDELQIEISGSNIANLSGDLIYRKSEFSNFEETSENEGRQREVVDYGQHGLDQYKKRGSLSESTSNVAITTTVRHSIGPIKISTSTNIHDNIDQEASSHIREVQDDFGSVECNPNEVDKLGVTENLGDRNGSATPKLVAQISQRNDESQMQIQACQEIDTTGKSNVQLTDRANIMDQKERDEYKKQADRIEKRHSESESPRNVEITTIVSKSMQPVKIPDSDRLGDFEGVTSGKEEVKDGTIAPQSSLIEQDEFDEKFSHRNASSSVVDEGSDRCNPLVSSRDFGSSTQLVQHKTKTLDDDNDDSTLIETVVQETSGPENLYDGKTKYGADKKQTKSSWRITKIFRRNSGAGVKIEPESESEINVSDMQDNRQEQSTNDASKEGVNVVISPTQSQIQILADEGIEQHKSEFHQPRDTQNDQHDRDVTIRDLVEHVDIDSASFPTGTAKMITKTSPRYLEHEQEADYERDDHKITEGDSTSGSNINVTTIVTRTSGQIQTQESVTDSHEPGDMTLAGQKRDNEPSSSESKQVDKAELDVSDILSDREAAESLERESRLIIPDSSGEIVSSSQFDHQMSNTLEETNLSSPIGTEVQKVTWPQSQEKLEPLEKQTKSSWRITKIFRRKSNEGAKIKHEHETESDMNANNAHDNRDQSIHEASQIQITPNLSTIGDIAMDQETDYRVQSGPQDDQVDRDVISNDLIEPMEIDSASVSTNRAEMFTKASSQSDTGDIEHEQELDDEQNYGHIEKSESPSIESNISITTIVTRSNGTIQIPEPETESHEMTQEMTSGRQELNNEPSLSESKPIVNDELDVTDELSDQEAAESIEEGSRLILMGKSGEIVSTPEFDHQTNSSSWPIETDAKKVLGSQIQTEGQAREKHTKSSWRITKIFRRKSNEGAKFEHESGTELDTNASHTQDRLDQSSQLASQMKTQPDSSTIDGGTKYQHSVDQVLSSTKNDKYDSDISVKDWDDPVNTSTTADKTVVMTKTSHSPNTRDPEHEKQPDREQDEHHIVRKGSTSASNTNVSTTVEEVPIQDSDTNENDEITSSIREQIDSSQSSDSSRIVDSQIYVNDELFNRDARRLSISEEARDNLSDNPDEIGHFAKLSQQIIETLDNVLAENELSTENKAEERKTSISQMQPEGQKNSQEDRKQTKSSWRITKIFRRKTNEGLEIDDKAESVLNTTDMRDVDLEQPADAASRPEIKLISPGQSQIQTQPDSSNLDKAEVQQPSEYQVPASSKNDKFDRDVKVQDSVQSINIESARQASDRKRGYESNSDLSTTMTVTQSTGQIQIADSDSKGNTNEEITSSSTELNDTLESPEADKMDHHESVVTDQLPNTDAIERLIEEGSRVKLTNKPDDFSHLPESSQQITGTVDNALAIGNVCPHIEPDVKEITAPQKQSVTQANSPTDKKQTKSSWRITRIFGRKADDTPIIQHESQYDIDSSDVPKVLNNQQSELDVDKIPTSESELQLTPDSVNDSKIDEQLTVVTGQHSSDADDIVEVDKQLEYDGLTVGTQKLDDQLSHSKSRLIEQDEIDVLELENPTPEVDASSTQDVDSAIHQGRCQDIGSSPVSHRQITVTSHQLDADRADSQYLSTVDSSKNSTVVKNIIVTSREIDTNRGHVNDNIGESNGSRSEISMKTILSTQSFDDNSNADLDGVKKDSDQQGYIHNKSNLTHNVEDKSSLSPSDLQSDHSVFRCLPLETHKKVDSQFIGSNDTRLDNILTDGEISTYTQNTFVPMRRMSLMTIPEDQQEFDDTCISDGASTSHRLDNKSVALETKNHIDEPQEITCPSREVDDQLRLLEPKRIEKDELDTTDEFQNTGAGESSIEEGSRVNLIGRPRDIVCSSEFDCQTTETSRRPNEQVETNISSKIETESQDVSGPENQTKMQENSQGNRKHTKSSWRITKIFRRKSNEGAQIEHEPEPESKSDMNASQTQYNLEQSSKQPSQTQIPSDLSTMDVITKNQGTGYEVLPTTQNDQVDRDVVLSDLVEPMEIDSASVSTNTVNNVIKTSGQSDTWDTEHDKLDYEQSDSNSVKRSSQSDSNVTLTTIVTRTIGPIQIKDTDINGHMNEPQEMTSLDQELGDKLEPIESKRIDQGELDVTDGFTDRVAARSTGEGSRVNLTDRLEQPEFAYKTSETVDEQFEINVPTPVEIDGQDVSGPQNQSEDEAREKRSKSSWQISKIFRRKSNECAKIHEHQSESEMNASITKDHQDQSSQLASQMQISPDLSTIDDASMNQETADQVLPGTQSDQYDRDIVMRDLVERVDIDSDSLQTNTPKTITKRSRQSDRWDQENEQNDARGENRVSRSNSNINVTTIGQIQIPNSDTGDVNDEARETTSSVKKLIGEPSSLESKQIDKVALDVSDTLSDREAAESLERESRLIFTDRPDEIVSSPEFADETSKTVDEEVESNVLRPVETDGQDVSGLQSQSEDEARQKHTKSSWRITKIFRRKSNEGAQIEHESESDMDAGNRKDHLDQSSQLAPQMQISHDLSNLNDANMQQLPDYQVSSDVQNHKHDRDSNVQDLDERVITESALVSTDTVNVISTTSCPSDTFDLDHEQEFTRDKYGDYPSNREQISESNSDIVEATNHSLSTGLIQIQDSVTKGHIGEEMTSPRLNINDERLLLGFKQTENHELDVTNELSSQLQTESINDDSPAIHPDRYDDVDTSAEFAHQKSKTLDAEIETKVSSPIEIHDQEIIDLQRQSDSKANLQEDRKQTKSSWRITKIFRRKTNEGLEIDDKAESVLNTTDMRDVDLEQPADVASRPEIKLNSPGQSQIQTQPDSSNLDESKVQHQPVHDLSSGTQNDNVDSDPIVGDLVRRMDIDSVSNEIVKVVSTNTDSYDTWDLEHKHQLDYEQNDGHAFKRDLLPESRVGVTITVTESSGQIQIADSDSKGNTNEEITSFSTELNDTLESPEADKMDHHESVVTDQLSNTDAIERLIEEGSRVKLTNKPDDISHLPESSQQITGTVDNVLADNNDIQIQATALSQIRSESKADKKQGKSSWRIKKIFGRKSSADIKIQDQLECEMNVTDIQDNHLDESTHDVSTEDVDVFSPTHSQIETQPDSSENDEGRLKQEPVHNLAPDTQKDLHDSVISASDLVKRVDIDSASFSTDTAKTITKTSRQSDTWYIDHEQNKANNVKRGSESDSNVAVTTTITQSIGPIQIHDSETETESYIQPKEMTAPNQELDDEANSFESRAIDQEELGAIDNVSSRKEGELVEKRGQVNLTDELGKIGSTPEHADQASTIVDEEVGTNISSPIKTDIQEVSEPESQAESNENIQAHGKRTKSSWRISKIFGRKTDSETNIQRESDFDMKESDLRDQSTNQVAQIQTPQHLPTIDEDTMYQGSEFNTLPTAKNDKHDFDARVGDLVQPIDTSLTPDKAIVITETYRQTSDIEREQEADYEQNDAHIEKSDSQSESNIGITTIGQVQIVDSETDGLKPQELMLRGPKLGGEASSLESKRIDKVALDLSDKFNREEAESIEEGSRVTVIDRHAEIVSSSVFGDQTSKTLGEEIGTDFREISDLQGQSERRESSQADRKQKKSSWRITKISPTQSSEQTSPDSSNLGKSREQQPREPKNFTDDGNVSVGDIVERVDIDPTSVSSSTAEIIPTTTRLSDKIDLNDVQESDYDLNNVYVQKGNSRSDSNSGITKTVTPSTQPMKNTGLVTESHMDEPQEMTSLDQELGDKLEPIESERIDQGELDVTDGFTDRVAARSTGEGSRVNLTDRLEQPEFAYKTSETVDEQFEINVPTPVEIDGQDVSGPQNKSEDEAREKHTKSSWRISKIFRRKSNEGAKIHEHQSESEMNASITKDHLDQSSQLASQMQISPDLSTIDDATMNQETVDQVLPGTQSDQYDRDIGMRDLVERVDIDSDSLQTNTPKTITKTSRQSDRWDQENEQNDARVENRVSRSNSNINVTTIGQIQIPNSETGDGNDEARETTSSDKKLIGEPSSLESKQIDKVALDVSDTLSDREAAESLERESRLIFTDRPDEIVSSPEFADETSKTVDEEVESNVLRPVKTDGRDVSGPQSQSEDEARKKHTKSSWRITKIFRPKSNEGAQIEQESESDMNANDTLDNRDQSTHEPSKMQIPPDLSTIDDITMDQEMDYQVLPGLQKDKLDRDLTNRDIVERVDIDSASVTADTDKMITKISRQSNTEDIEHEQQLDYEQTDNNSVKRGSQSDVSVKTIGSIQILDSDIKGHVEENQEIISRIQIVDSEPRSLEFKRLDKDVLYVSDEPSEQVSPTSIEIRSQFNSTDELGEIGSMPEIAVEIDEEGETEAQEVSEPISQSATQENSPTDKKQTKSSWRITRIFGRKADDTPIIQHESQYDIDSSDVPKVLNNQQSELDVDKIPTSESELQLTPDSVNDSKVDEQLTVVTGQHSSDADDIVEVDKQLEYDGLTVGMQKLDDQLSHSESRLIEQDEIDVLELENPTPEVDASSTQDVDSAIHQGRCQDIGSSPVSHRQITVTSHQLDADRADSQYLSTVDSSKNSTVVKNIIVTSREIDTNRGHVNDNIGESNGSRSEISMKTVLSTQSFDDNSNADLLAVRSETETKPHETISSARTRSLAHSDRQIAHTEHRIDSVDKNVEAIDSDRDDDANLTSRTLSTLQRTTLASDIWLRDSDGKVDENSQHPLERLGKIIHQYNNEDALMSRLEAQTPDHENRPWTPGHKRQQSLIQVGTLNLQTDETETKRHFERSLSEQQNLGGNSFDTLGQLDSANIHIPSLDSNDSALQRSDASDRRVEFVLDSSEICHYKPEESRSIVQSPSGSSNKLCDHSAKNVVNISETHRSESQTRVSNASTTTAQLEDQSVSYDVESLVSGGSEAQHERSVAGQQTYAMLHRLNETSELEHEPEQNIQPVAGDKVRSQTEPIELGPQSTEGVEPKKLRGVVSIKGLEGLSVSGELQNSAKPSKLELEPCPNNKILQPQDSFELGTKSGQTVQPTEAQVSFRQASSRSGSRGEQSLVLIGKPSKELGDFDSDRDRDRDRYRDLTTKLASQSPKTTTHEQSRNELRSKSASKGAPNLGSPTEGTKGFEVSASVDTFSELDNTSKTNNDNNNNNDNISSQVIINEDSNVNSVLDKTQRQGFVEGSSSTTRPFNNHNNNDDEIVDTSSNGEIRQSSAKSLGYGRQNELECKTAITSEPVKQETNRLLQNHSDQTKAREPLGFELRQSSEQQARGFELVRIGNEQQLRSSNLKQQNYGGEQTNDDDDDDDKPLWQEELSHERSERQKRSAESDLTLKSDGLVSENKIESKQTTTTLSQSEIVASLAADHSGRFSGNKINNYNTTTDANGSGNNKNNNNNNQIQACHEAAIAEEASSTSNTVIPECKQAQAAEIGDGSHREITIIDHRLANPRSEVINDSQLEPAEQINKSSQELADSVGLEVEAEVVAEVEVGVDDVDEVEVDESKIGEEKEVADDRLVDEGSSKHTNRIVIVMNNASCSGEESGLKHQLQNQQLQQQQQNLPSSNRRSEDDDELQNSMNPIEPNKHETNNHYYDYCNPNLDLTTSTNSTTTTTTTTPTTEAVSNQKALINQAQSLEHNSADKIYKPKSKAPISSEAFKQELQLREQQQQQQQHQLNTKNIHKDHHQYWQASEWKQQEEGESRRLNLSTFDSQAKQNYQSIDESKPSSSVRQSHAQVSASKLESDISAPFGHQSSSTSPSHQVMTTSISETRLLSYRTTDTTNTNTNTNINHQHQHQSPVLLQSSSVSEMPNVILSPPQTSQSSSNRLARNGLKSSASYVSNMSIYAGNNTNHNSQQFNRGKFVKYYASWRHPNQHTNPIVGQQYPNYSFHLPQWNRSSMVSRQPQPQQQQQQQLKSTTTGENYNTTYASPNQIAFDDGYGFVVPSNRLNSRNIRQLDEHRRQQIHVDTATKPYRSTTIPHLPSMVKFSTVSWNKLNNYTDNDPSRPIEQQTLMSRSENELTAPAANQQQQADLQSRNIKAHRVSVNRYNLYCDNPFKPGTELSWEADLMVRLMRRGYPIQELPLLVETAKQVARDEQQDSLISLDGSSPERAMIHDGDKPNKQSKEADKGPNNDLEETRSLQSEAQARQSRSLRRQNSIKRLGSAQKVWATSLERARSLPRYMRTPNPADEASSKDLDSIDLLIMSIEREIDRNSPQTSDVVTSFTSDQFKHSTILEESDNHKPVRSKSHQSLPKAATRPLGSSKTKSKGQNGASTRNDNKRKGVDRKVEGDDDDQVKGTHSKCWNCCCGCCLCRSK